MNCVPGMVTKFAFTPSMTTEEIEKPEMVEKVSNINKIRNKKSAQNVCWKEKRLLDHIHLTFLLCNKICGASHYNMQMKIVVDTPRLQKWLKKSKPLSLLLKLQLKNPTAKKVLQLEKILLLLK
jgi:cytochrome c oxidase subunit 2